MSATGLLPFVIMALVGFVLFMVYGEFTNHELYRWAVGLTATIIVALLFGAQTTAAIFVIALASCLMRITPKK